MELPRRAARGRGPRRERADAAAAAPRRGSRSRAAPGGRGARSRARRRLRRALLELSRIPGALGTRFGLVTAVAAGVAACGAVLAAESIWLPVLRPGAEAAALVLVLAPRSPATRSPPTAGRARVPGRRRPHGRRRGLDRRRALARPARRPPRRPPRRRRGLRANRCGGRGRPRRDRVLRAAAELTSVSQVWSTSYGRLLVAKTILFALLLAVGRTTGRLVVGGAARDLRLALALETALLATLVAAVAGLASVTPPRSEALAVAPPSLPGPAVVFGRQAGGRRRRAVGGARAAARSASRRTAIGPTAAAEGADVGLGRRGAVDRRRPCLGAGIYCASAAVERDTPSVRVRLERPGGDESTVGFTLPARPQRARAKRLLAHTARRTRALRTVVIDEHLAPASGSRSTPSSRSALPTRCATARRRSRTARGRRRARRS